MAAGAWNLNQYGKLKIGNGTIQLDSGNVFRLGLYQTGASANIVADISIQTSIGNEVAFGGASSYTAGGTTLSSNTWALSGANGKFDSSDWIITGSATQTIKYAYIVLSGGGTSGHLLCYSTLSGTAFALSGTNTLTIQMNASGIFTLA